MIDKGRRYQMVIGLVIILFIAGLVYCGVLLSKENDKSNELNSTVIETEDTTRTFIGVVKDLSREAGTITILGVENPVVTNFRYNGGTDVKDQYGKVVSMKKISLGEIVEYSYDYNTNKLISLSIYEHAWTYENIKKMKMDQEKRMIELGSSRYGYTESLLYVGDNELISSSDINPKDQLMVKGIGDTIYSMIVTKGHGTIHFTGFEDFVGGMVSIGAGTYMRVQDTMNVVMREGTYKVTMQNGELVGTKEVIVERGQEVTVDMSEFKAEKPKVGEVTFHVNPYGADLYVNGTAMDYSNPIVLNYGEHTIRVSLNGYKPFSGVLTVGQEEQDIEIILVLDTSKEESSTESDHVQSDTSDSTDDLDDIVLDWDSDSTKDTESSTTPSKKPSASPSPSASTGASNAGTASPSASPSASPTIDKSHKITVSSPADVEVYLDDSYKGIAPVSFTKVLGSHTITLKKDGYVTKKYTIHVENDSENVFYTFAALVKE